jgi:hypothetical protein
MLISLNGLAPKRPMSAYFIYQNEHRAATKQEHPELSVGEVSKFLASQWSELPPQEKDTYEQLAKKAMEKYAKDKESYESTYGKIPAKKRKKKGGDDEDESPAKKAKAKKEKKPRAKSAFIMFSSEKRKELKESHPHLAFGDVGKELGKAWGELSKEQKAIWEEKAKAATLAAAAEAPAEEEHDAEETSD